MLFNKQPFFSTPQLTVSPLKPEDFEALYSVASDPLVWEQHPNKDRYKREVFMNFFKGAMESEGALIIRDAVSNEVLGCSRYYDLDEEKSQIAIGYTFYGRNSWGTGINKAVKKLMIDHVFETLDNVIFHIGADNIRSQKAIEKIGAVKVDEENMAYYGEPVRHNFVYRIEKVKGNR